ncbi:MAG: NADH-quinone oxidoreductase subunit C [Bacteroidota bacterium]
MASNDRLMEKPTIDTVLAMLSERFSDAIISVEKEYDFHVIVLHKDKLTQVLRSLYEDEIFQFRYLTTLCGLHFPASPKPFGVMYQTHSLVHNLRLRFKTFTTADDLEFESLTSVFPAANWLERETFDFFGFKFKGHPNLRRILNLDDMDYHPLRKEYPIEDATRYDKDDTMFGRIASGYDRKRLQS